MTHTFLSGDDISMAARIFLGTSALTFVDSS